MCDPCVCSLLPVYVPDVLLELFKPSTVSDMLDNQQGIAIGFCPPCWAYYRLSKVVCPSLVDNLTLGTEDEGTTDSESEGKDGASEGEDQDNEGEGKDGASEGENQDNEGGGDKKNEAKSEKSEPLDVLFKQLKVGKILDNQCVSCGLYFDAAGGSKAGHKGRVRVQCANADTTIKKGQKPPFCLSGAVTCRDCCGTERKHLYCYPCFIVQKVPTDAVYYGKWNGSTGFDLPASGFHREEGSEADDYSTRILANPKKLREAGGLRSVCAEDWNYEKMKEYGLSCEGNWDRGGSKMKPAAWNHMVSALAGAMEKAKRGLVERSIYEVMDLLRESRPFKTQESLERYKKVSTLCRKATGNSCYLAGINSSETFSLTYRGKGHAEVSNLVSAEVLLE